MPCRIGASHCCLRHIGCEECGHGLTSRPRETSEPGFLDSLLQVLGYSGGSGALLLAGELPCGGIALTGLHGVSFAGMCRIVATFILYLPLVVMGWFS